jgi:hypothetical protein
MRVSATARHVPLAWLLALAGGCYSGADASGSGASADGSATNGQDEGGTDSSGETDGETDGDTNDDGGPTSELPTPTTRFFRLTHQQWENTVQDLFYLPEPTGLSSYFRGDTPAQGYLFANDANSLSVDGALWSGYQLAAVDTAQLVVADPEVMSAILPVDGGDDAARADAFIRDFGLRAFRRPLSEGEVAEYFALYGGAEGLYENSTGFDAGIRLVIETMMQSPHFLYRIEASTEPTGEVIELDSFEVASRLSYFLWDTMPDDELLDAAVADELASASTVREHALRMLDDGRAQPVVQYFHDVIFETPKILATDPSEAVYPDVPPEIGQYALEEFRLFVEDALLGQSGGIRRLLTSNETFVNADLAAIYGVDGAFGAQFEKVTLPDNRRKGVLTQVGFLTANAASVNPDPIHRGKFISERIVCAELPAPPDDIPPLPEDVQGQTNREAIEALTEVPGSNCAGCHATLINPFGFPFEHYDAVGAYRTQDNGFDVDASSSVLLDGGSVDVNNALELVDTLAESPAVHECYLKHWVEYAHGRPFADLDEPLVERLGALSIDENLSVKELLVEVVVSQPFLTRATEELP